MCEIPERSRAREGNIPGAVEVEEEEGEETEKEEIEREKETEKKREDERERNFQKACRHRARRKVRP